MRGFVYMLFGLVATISANPLSSERIVGGDETSIEQYPELVAILYILTTTTFSQGCGGTIINNRAILTADHCVDFIEFMRIRVGSTYANSGGTVHLVAQAIRHPVQTGLFHDIAILHSTTAFEFSDFVKPGRIAGPNYVVPDDDSLMAAGWGRTTDPALNPNSMPSEVLRHVQLKKVNLQICAANYAAIHQTVSDNFLCAGWLDGGGKSQCRGDSGSPLYHNGVVVGVCSHGPPISCGDPRHPGVNMRVANYSNWITSNA